MWLVFHFFCRTVFLTKSLWGVDSRQSTGWINSIKRYQSEGPIVCNAKIFQIQDSSCYPLFSNITIPHVSNNLYTLCNNLRLCATNTCLYLSLDVSTHCQQAGVPTCDLRLLDSDLQAVLKAKAEFEIDRIPFLLEATWAYICYALFFFYRGFLIIPGKKLKPLQAAGKTLDEYMIQHQDRSRNALLKSQEAAFLAWCEELKADQSQYDAESFMSLG